MGRFLLKILGFLLFPVVFITVAVSIIIFSVGIDAIPALNFSDSYSFNEKILFLNKQPQNPEILAIGSSMTLINLHSDVVVNKFQSNKYINASSWGLRMEEDFHLLKLLNGIYDLKRVIIVSNVVDFQKSAKRIDYDFVNNYLINRYPWILFHIAKNFSLSYYFENIKYANYVRNCLNDYECLKYDQYGMVRYSRNNFKITEKRWSKKGLDKKLSESEYAFLDSISTFCTKNHLKLYFFVSPIRKSLYSNLDSKELDILHTHLNKVNSILNNKHIVVNSNLRIWNDSLFVDGIHFNEFGAEVFTNFCFDQINEEARNNDIPNK